MPRLVLIRGVPGTGKTTLAREYAKQGYVHCENDQYFLGHGGKYPFNEALWPAAKNDCLLRVGRAMHAGKDVVVANTFTQHWQMDSYLNLAHALGYEVNIITLTHEYGSIHNVPAEMARIRAIWED